MKLLLSLTRRLVAGVLLGGLALMLAGCANEETNPLGTEKLGSTAKTDDWMVMSLDCRGYLNGVFVPAEEGQGRGYPVSYVGSWTIMATNRTTGHYVAYSSHPGDRVDFTATCSRVIFEFYDYDQFPNAGLVSFTLDGAPLGSFELKRQDAAGNKISQFQVTTGKTTVATVSMRLERGSAVIAAFHGVFADRAFRVVN